MKNDSEEKQVAVPEVEVSAKVKVPVKSGGCRHNHNANPLAHDTCGLFAAMAGCSPAETKGVAAVEQTPEVKITPQAGCLGF